MFIDRVLVWLIKIGEPLPIGGRSSRKFRAALLAEALAKNGDEVVWWTSRFDHQRKEFVPVEAREVEWIRGVRMRFLEGGGYRKSGSLGRWLHHWRLARRLMQEMRELVEGEDGSRDRGLCEVGREEDGARSWGLGEASRLAPKKAAASCRTPKDSVCRLPDLILAAWPALELAWVAVRIGREYGIPVIIDVRDLWPAIIPFRFPKLMRPPVRLVLGPIHWMARWTLRNATGIVGASDGFLDWAVNYCGRMRRDTDAAFPLAARDEPIPAEEARRARRFWEEVGVEEQGTTPIIVYTGTLGWQFDLAGIFKALELLQSNGRRVRFIVCGSGDREARYRRMGRSLTGYLQFGWLDWPLVRELLARAWVGVNPLPDRFDYKVHVNNKAVDYLAAGVPMAVCPPDSLLGRMVESEGCGITYRAGEAKDLAGRLGRLFDDEKKLKEMRLNARRVFEQRFWAEKVYPEYVGYLERIAKRTGH